MADKLSDEELLSICRREEQDAQNWQTSALTANRTEAFAYYDRQLQGDEQEGQSKIVTSEFADTIESHMPGLMRVFASGENVAEFTPENQGDEEWAKQASKYVPHVYMRENPGFTNLHTLFKDALMYRLGGQVVDVETVPVKRKRAVKPEDMFGEDALAFLKQEAETQKAELDSSGLELDPATGFYTGTVATVTKKKKVVISCIAPEHILFTPSATSRGAASFSGYLKPASASELRMMDVPQDQIDELQSDKTPDVEENQRNPDALVNERGRTDRRDSERRFWIVVAWVKADQNGDGISETYRVVYAHGGGDRTKLIDKTEWDGSAPVIFATPILMPHTIAGRSVFDQTKDLQDIGTALTRGMLDNLYITNRPRLGISNRVDINSVLDWTPGSPVRMVGADNPREHISEITVPSVIAPVLTALEYLATVKENRTGVVRNSQGLDADQLDGATATGVNAVMGASQQRQELIARVFAETSIKDVMRETYRAIKRAATGPTQYWDGQDWANCDPTQWPDDMDLTVSVGMGTGNKQMELQHLTIIGTAQEKLIMAQGGQVTKDSPYVKPEHIANTGRKIVEAAGQRASQLFIASPKEIEASAQNPPQQPQSPEMLKVQADAAAAAAKHQADTQLAQQKLQSDIALKQQANAADLQAKREAAALDMQLSREKAAQDMALAREKAAMELDLKRQELELEAQLRAVEIARTPTAQPNIQEATPG